MRLTSRILYEECLKCVLIVMGLEKWLWMSYECYGIRLEWFCMINEMFSVYFFIYKIFKCCEIFLHPSYHGRLLLDFFKIWSLFCNFDSFMISYIHEAFMHVLDTHLDSLRFYVFWCLKWLGLDCDRHFFSNE